MIDFNEEFKWSVIIETDTEEVDNFCNELIAYVTGLYDPNGASIEESFGLVESQQFKNEETDTIQKLFKDTIEYQKNGFGSLVISLIVDFNNKNEWNCIKICFNSPPTKLMLDTIKNRANKYSAFKRELDKDESFNVEIKNVYLVKKVTKIITRKI